MQNLQRSIVGFLVSFGVALVLISTAGAASAQEATPTTGSQDEAVVGDAVFVERPAPRPDAANELRTAPAPADDSATPAPAPAPVPDPATSAVPSAAPRSGAGPAAAPVRAPATRPRTATTPAVASAAPARATEVQGVQIVRSAEPTGAPAATLALTGIDREVALTLAAVLLLAFGSALLRLSRSPRLA